jgi:hypothetical protein
MEFIPAIAKNEIDSDFGMLFLNEKMLRTIIWSKVTFDFDEFRITD